MTLLRGGRIPRLLEAPAASTSVGRTSGLPVDVCSEGVDLRRRMHFKPAGQRLALSAVTDI